MKKIFQLYKRYLHLVMQYRVMYIGSWITAILLLFVGNLSTFVIGNVIDDITSNQASSLLPMVFLIAGVLAIPLILDPITFKLKTLFLTKVVADIMKRVYSNVMKLDHSYHINKQTGKLISIILNTTDVVSIFGWQLEWFVFDHLASLLVPLVLITIISWEVGLVIIALLVVTSPLLYWILNLNMKRRSDLKEADYERNAAIIDGLGNYETVRSFGTENKEISRLSKLIEVSSLHMNRYQDTFRIIDFVARALGVSIFMIAGWYATRQYQSGALSLGMFIVILSYLTNITGDIMGMIFSFRDVMKNVSISEDLFDLLDAPAHILEDSAAVTLSDPRGVIAFTNVTFAYENKTPILKDISLHIPAGFNVALVGPSGGGKTTMTRLIMRYYDIQQGSITIDGVPVKQLSFESLRQIMGLVPQEPVLFNKSLAYNIGYALPDIENADNKENLAIIKQAAQRAHIDDFIESLPDGYNTLVGERGLKLSGGQKQRVAIARVLIKDPQIVIFDEATSMLDSASEKAIQLAFRELSKDKTTIVIAHRLSTITHSDLIFYIDDGKVLEQGTHAQLLHKNGPYAHLWEIQSGGFTKG